MKLTEDIKDIIMSNTCNSSSGYSIHPEFDWEQIEKELKDVNVATGEGVEE